MLNHRILRSVLAIAAALLLQASAAGAEESVESGVNRPGRDYKNFEMEPSIAGFAPCQAACSADGACRAWTFVKPGVKGPKAHCWLKKSVPDPVKNDCCVSGVSGVISGIEFDTNRPGKDYRDFGISNVNVIVRDQPELICRTTCEKEAKCQAWTYVKPAKEGADARCWLKTAAPGKQRNNCCTSGVVTRADPQEIADRDPAGKSLEQCEQAYARNSARCLARSGGNFTVKIGCDAEMLQLRGVCLNLAAQAGAGGGTTGGGSGGGVPAEWADTLNLHNAKRAMHRAPPLSWSASLASEAQSWANNCNFEHSDSNGYGENLAQGSNLTGKASVELWYAEVGFYDWNNPIASFNAGTDDPAKETRHFTQVVWRDTTTLGCGLKQCGGQNLVVCRYKPPGNFNANDPGVLEANVQQ